MLLVQKVKLSDNIWFYNLSKYSVLSYFFLRYIYRKKVFIILADYTPGRSFFSFQTILKYLLCHSCGLVTLSSRTNIQNNNTISIAGIISTKKLINEIRPIHKRIRFLFSGSLNTITGFEMVLRVFSRLPQCELYITGNGKFPQTYSNFTNLHFLGMLDYDEYKKVLVNSDVCLSFRNPHLVENCNNFPSKILEYFCFGKIVISTIKYPELADAKYIILPFNEDDMVECIDKIVSDLSNNRIAPSNYDNRDFLQDNFSISAWEKGFEKIEKNCIS